MLKRNYLGTTISFVLPENQYKGYVVDCTYKIYQAYEQICCKSVVKTF